MYINEFPKIPYESLDKFAKLRVLEVTNGVTQWAFRRGNKECLSVDKTRECMNLVMSFMKNIELYFPSEGLIQFNQIEKYFINAGDLSIRMLLKIILQDKEREYHQSATAQFIVYGHLRTLAAMDLVKKDYESLFSPYYIERGQKKSTLFRCL